MIIRPQASSLGRFTRVITLDSGGLVTLVDKVEIPKPQMARIEQVFSGGEFYSRYVPQSRYFLLETNKRSCEESKDLLFQLKSSGYFSMERKI